MIELETVAQRDALDRLVEHLAELTKHRSHESAKDVIRRELRTRRVYQHTHITQLIMRERARLRALAR